MDSKDEKKDGLHNWLDKIHILIENWNEEWGMGMKCNVNVCSMFIFE